MPSKPYKRINAFLFSTVPLLGLGIYLYGPRPLIMIVIAVVFSIISDVLVALMRKRKYDGKDLSSIMYTVILVLLLPASLKYGIVICGIFFTLFIKHAFGGQSGNIFHPSAFGYVTTAICWPNEIFRYPYPFSKIGILKSNVTMLYDSPAFTIRNGETPITVDKSGFILGSHPGPLGASFCIVVIAILLFLIACKVASWHAPFIYLLTVIVFAFVFPRLQVGRLESVMYEIFSDVLVFAAVYIVEDPITSPVNPRAKIIYGFLLGLLAILFNHFGAYQQGVLFAVLLVNPLSSFLDRKFIPKGVKTR